jgi:hypothetical protein
MDKFIFPNTNEKVESTRNENTSININKINNLELKSSKYFSYREIKNL